jgi:DNA-binding transcriptional MerR regulator
MADDERRDATVVLTTARATGTAHPITVSISRETWTDWIRAIDPGFDESSVEYLTVDELLEELDLLITRDSEKVDAVTIRYWQRKRLLPYPVKRWHEGATRSLYPIPSAVQLIVHIRLLQREGYTLEQIAPRLRGHLAMLCDPTPLELRPTIIEAANRRASFTGRPIREVIVTFVDEEGWRVEYPFPIERT